MARGPRILIAGAGLGGLTAALALLRQGFDVEVHEQARDLREIGAGVQLAANGTRVLYELGIGDPLEAIATELGGKAIRLWNTGKSWDLIDLGTSSIERYGAPYFALHRADLHEVLARAVRAEKADALRLNSRAIAFDQSDRGVTLRLETGETASGDALIGADGVHSKVRQALFGPDRPQFTGCMAWRGLAPTEGLPETISRTGGVFWLGPGAHIVTYPVRRGAFINFIAIINRDDWTVESWNARGTIEECAGDFPGWHADVHAMIQAIGVPYKWALIVREPLPQWTQGRVSLLGDACHSTLPLLAQGANMAIEDGYILARCLDGHRDDIPAGLARYERSRIARTSDIVRESAAQLGRNSHPALADPTTAEAHIAREFGQHRINDRYDWVYGYDATRAAIA
jgi:salicylate hydroxylase